MKKTILMFVGIMFGLLSLLFAEAHHVYLTLVPNPGRFLGCMSDGGWDGSEICSTQVDEECPECYDCCGDTYSCSRVGGYGSGLARAKWDACMGHCITDLQGCDEMPDPPSDGGTSTGGGGSES